MNTDMNRPRSLFLPVLEADLVSPTRSRQVLPMSSERRLTKLEDSEDYHDRAADPMETEECKVQHPWQLSSFPAGNTVHELDLEGLVRTNETLIVNAGYWRDVWLVRGDDQFIAKTQRYEHDFTERNLDRHRRDAISMERSSSSPFVLDIYGFVGGTGLFEFADGGDLAKFLWTKNGKPIRRTPLEKLTVAVQAAQGLAAAHHVDRDDTASLAHADLSLGQYVRVGNVFKLNDFNRARLLRTNRTSGDLCPFRVANNPGTFRSPEEYNYHPETEKIDIFSLGNILYCILEQRRPFEELKSKHAKKKVRHGKRAKFTADSSVEANVVLMNVTGRCWEHEPELRPSAIEVAQFLQDAIERLGGKDAQPIM